MLSLADDKTRIVADEGAPASTESLKASRDMLVTLRARVQQLIDAGKSEDEVVAAKPTKDFDAQWVHPGNFVTGDTMTRLAYQSLKGSRSANTNTAGSVFSGTNSGANRRPLLYTPEEPVVTATYCLPSTA